MHNIPYQNTVGRWMCEIGSIQRSNIRRYKLVLKSAKRTHLWSSCKISLTNNTVGRWMYENGSIQHSDIRTYGLVLKSAKKTHLWSSCTISPTKILLGVECAKLVAFNALTSGDINSYLNQLKELICDLHAKYPLPIILLGVECTKIVAFNTLTSGHMDSCVNQLNHLFAIFIHNIPHQ